METLQLLIALIVMFFLTASCYPPKPLSERSRELAWQAWLLVDENQNRQNENIPRRRITPKSVFIAPTFSPENLPPCADGYASDPMGRCIKIIKLDEDAHLEFLLQKLNEKFGDADYTDEDEEISSTTTGPFQFNIPLDVGSKNEFEETDMAIVVAPTNSNFEDDNFKFDTKRQNDEKNVNQPEDDIKTISPEISTTENNEITTTLLPDTTTTDSTEETTFYTTEIPTTTEQTTVTTEEHSTVTSTEPFQETTTMRKLKDVDLTDYMSDGTPLPELTERVAKPSSRIRFPVNNDRAETVLDFVRFPEETQESVPQYQRTRDTVHQVKPSEEDTIFHRRENNNFFREPLINELQPPLPLAGEDHTVYNHRTRDRQHMFMLPPRWHGEDLQRPLVLRFSRKHAYVDTDQFKHPDFYRAVPPSDLSFIFGFKKRRFSNTNR